MGMTHWVKTKSGESYTDRGGVEKESYITVGKMIENAKGNKIIVLDAIPFSWLGGGKPVYLYLQAKDEPKPVTAPAAPVQKSLPEDDDGDIPF